MPVALSPGGVSAARRSTGLGGAAFVAMMQAANLRDSDVATVAGLLCRPRQRGVFCQAQVRAGLMVIGDERS